MQGLLSNVRNCKTKEELLDELKNVPHVYLLIMRRVILQKAKELGINTI